MKATSCPDYASRIRTLREQLSLTQTQLAERVGVTYVTVNRWENEQNVPSSLAWEKIQTIEAHASEANGEVSTTETEESAPLDFEGNPNALRAVVEAERLRHAYHYNPAFASEVSRIDPLPHQRIAVYERMLPQPRLRFLLADDAGAGKTIMSGLYLREMLSRRLLRRILIVPPAGLVGNWQRELQHLFNLDFQIVSGYDARSGNPFTGEKSDQTIISVDTLAADSAFGRLAEDETEPYDLVIFDEAHKLSVRRGTDGQLEKTQRYKLGEALAGIHEEGQRWQLGWKAHHFLLLTATPHMGKDFPYYGLWRLLEPEALATQEAFHNYPQDARRRHYIRRTKEEMVSYEGASIYPTRVLDTLNYQLTPAEDNLYDATTEYLDRYYNRAQVLNRSAVQLAKSVFQRRLTSSTYALLKSFERREAKLTDLIEAVRDARLSETEIRQRQHRLSGVTDVFAEMTADEEVLGEGREMSEQMEEDILAAVADVSLGKLSEEREAVRRLQAQARNLYGQGDESKFERLHAFLETPDYEDEKILIFTEHRDTLDFITRRLEGLGYAGRIAQIHGGMPHGKRDEQVRYFEKKVEDGGAQYLVATDAAGEGINLQFCWLMVNYDVPWNPARLEQRMGRIHRYGQDHDPVVIMNLVSRDTRDGRVQQTLLEKLDRIRKELGSDKVFDVIGKELDDKLMSEYVRRALEGSQTEETTVQAELGDRLTADHVQAVEAEEKAQYGEQGDVRSRLPELKAARETERFRQLLPGYVQQFVTRAAPLLNLNVEGNVSTYFRLRPQEEDALEPLWPILETYPEEARARLTTHKPAYDESCIWLHPGEPLFDRLQSLVMGRYLRSARRGAMFTDVEADDPYLLYFLNTSIERAADDELDALKSSERRGERFVAARIDSSDPFEEVAPEQLFLLRSYDGAKTSGLDLIAQSKEASPRAKSFARDTVAARMVRKERERLEETVEKRQRFLRRGFEYRKGELADRRSNLREQKKEDVPGAKEAYRRVKEKQQRLRDRQRRAVAVVEREPELVRPRGTELIGCALVLPSQDLDDKLRRDDQVEAIAMREAVAFERARGATVTDVSEKEKAAAAGLPEWPGFDLLSDHPDEEGKRGIEVKGRARVGDVLLHDNEWSAAVNQRERYWLYVVYDCATSNPRLLRVQDPHGSLVANPKGDVIIDEQEIFKAARSEHNGS